LTPLFPATTVKRLTWRRFCEALAAQRHCAKIAHVVLFLLAEEAAPQQSERIHEFGRGPVLCGGAKFGMVY